MSEPLSTPGKEAASAVPSQQIEPPPTTILGILGRLGPGLIIAGAIVGSGELIATTKTGAEAGFWLLWLILIGCVIKLFAQVEFGRYAISSGETTMSALNEVPGPRLRANWVLWYWLVMFIVTLAQLGGIVGGVGQSLAMSLPLSGDVNRLLDEQDQWTEKAGPIESRLREAEAGALAARDPAVRQAAEARILAGVKQSLGPRPDRKTRDDVYWAVIVTAVTVVLLVAGRYRLIQNVSTFFVAAFTAVTIFNLFALQSHEAWAVSWGDWKEGLSFRLPPKVEGLARSPLATALATFGIIGVGANELITYPYWCLEKGYARFTGPRDDSAAWVERARGWMRVMRWDATISMVIFTFATVAFYLLGAAVLHREGLDPEGNRMIRVLGQMYVPVFGEWAQWLFLFGAFAVLYSTFFVANAGHARVASDAVRVFGVGAATERARIWWVRALCAGFPTFSLIVYVFIREPVGLVLAGGVAQAMMLPILGAATLYFRYRRCDPRIAPGRLWDLMTWISVAGLALAGISAAVMLLLKHFK
jgi:Mn2+/Fe2+ NRAMP family transporter